MSHCVEADYQFRKVLLQSRLFVPPDRHFEAPTEQWLDCNGMLGNAVSCLQKMAKGVPPAHIFCGWSGTVGGTEWRQNDSVACPH